MNVGSLEKGNVVVAKTGSTQPMVISSIDEDNENVECFWFEGHIIHHRKFSKKELLLKPNFNEWKDV